ncbi:hypothetical protein ACQEU3_46480 [Spirillospora sp. CA-253888]
MKTLLARITARGAEQVTVQDGRGQVCTRACRAAAHRDRVTVAAYRARL